MPLAKDLLHPSPEEEKRKHKKKRLVQSPNSYFMDVKCPALSLSPQVVTRSRRCSATLRPSCCAWAARPCYASPRGARPG
ncbi:40S ribosomal protein S27 isoform X2 [Rissa tridactyla]|uniref:40S ribosomal protein S27 isoform X2 n=1 Tax=Rissa tridactyla TaxID=75485 RepID=UPI0023BA9EC9|nr:40S ribosomal protein S27 isoform X2 [Rissa tridactyla]